MSKICAAFVLCGLLAGCTAGLYSSTVGLDTHQAQRAISYDGQVEYVLERTNDTLIKAIEYRSRGSESPQIAMVLLFVCSLQDGAEDCYPLTDATGTQLTYGATGTGLLNDSLAGIGAAAVAAGGFAGAARLLRPARYTESTHVEGVSGATAGRQTGDVSVDTDAYAGSNSRSYSQSHSRAVNTPRTKITNTSRSTINQPPAMPMMPGPGGND